MLGKGIDIALLGKRPGEEVFNSYILGHEFLLQHIQTCISCAFVFQKSIKDH